MKNSKKIEFLGLFDLESGSEFGMPVLVIKPYVSIRDGNNVGEAEQIIEGYMIGLSLYESPKSERIDKKQVLRDFQDAKNGSKRFRKWSATVTYSKNNPIEYKISKRIGF